LVARPLAPGHGRGGEPGAGASAAAARDPGRGPRAAGRTPLATTPPHEYQVLVRVTPPFTATLAMVAPSGVRTTVTREVR
jgi:hypothetical protein